MSRCFGPDERYGCIMVDVDCKDRSLAMSCPPANFVEASFIDTIKECLTLDGKFTQFLKSALYVTCNYFTSFPVYRAISLEFGVPRSIQKE